MKQWATHNFMTALIASGTKPSQALAIQGYTGFGLQMPAAFTGATIKFQVSADNVTYQDLYDKTNTLVSVTVAVDRHYTLPDDLAPWAFVKIVSASNEGADRSLIFIAKY